MGNGSSSGAAGKRGSDSADSHQSNISSPAHLTELLVPGAIPRMEVPGWRERYGAAAGITIRGAEPGRGFDLGLWSREPVGEVMNRWLSFRREMGAFRAIALGNQIHGTELLRLDSGRGWIYVDGIDGWITTSPGVMVTVTVADCIPVYLLAPGRGAGLLHAGWRGTAGGILERGVRELRQVTGAPEGDIVMHCGVGICGNCYEVGSEVMEECGVAVVGEGPWHLDLRSRLVEQALDLGLIQVTSSSWCSAHDRGRFYSHRASKGSDGRMVAYLGLLGDRLASNLHPA